MCEANQTQVTQLHLLGFQGLYKFRPLFFIVCLLCYLVILSGNFLTVILVTIDDHLKIPMFFFLKHLAITDVLLTTSVVPILLHMTLSGEGALTLVACFLQLYCFLVFGSVTTFIIVVMSYDRFLAICRPLHYASLMGPQVCHRLVIISWLLSTLLMSSEIIVVFQFSFCGVHYVYHFYCEIGTIKQLTTSDNPSFVVQRVFVFLLLIPFPLAFIVIMYVGISFTILKIPSAIGRKKAFSTCSSHLATVFICYGSLITVFFVPKNYSRDSINKYTSLLSIVVTPMMNPLIYSLSNKEIKRSFLKLLSGVGINV